MLLIIATLLITLATAWAHYHNGLFSSVAMLIKVVLAGLVAFNFWEPIADYLDPAFQNNVLAGAEDLISLMVLFTLALFVLRLLTNKIAPEMIEEHGTVQHLGAGVVGLVTGYLLAGFLMCALQTLPLDENFMGFTPRSPGEPAYRSLVPPDRVWLVMMRHAGAYPFSWTEEPRPEGTSAVERYQTFDRNATFELRYQRYRRFPDTGKPLIYVGEFDRELGKQKPK
jgi:uncharacterized membrane protein required for colicin V production